MGVTFGTTKLSDYNASFMCCCGFNFYFFFVLNSLFIYLADCACPIVYNLGLLHFECNYTDPPTIHKNVFFIIFSPLYILSVPTNKTNHWLDHFDHDSVVWFFCLLTFFKQSTVLCVRRTLIYLCFFLFNLNNTINHHHQQPPP